MIQTRVLFWLFQVTQYPIKDQSGCVAALSLVFVGSGLFVLSLLLTKSEELGPWSTAAVAFVGIAHLLAGLFSYHRTPIRQVHVDIARREIHITTRSLRGKSHRVISAGEITGVHIEPGTDSDGDKHYLPRIRLKSGEWVPLVGVPRRSEAEALADLRMISTNILGSSSGDGLK